jgi:hypothetical protein
MMIIDSVYFVTETLMVYTVVAVITYFLGKRKYAKNAV